jgi:hypothetical protein
MAGQAQQTGLLNLYVISVIKQSPPDTTAPMEKITTQNALKKQKNADTAASPCSITRE